MAKIELDTVFGQNGVEIIPDTKMTKVSRYGRVVVGHTKAIIRIVPKVPQRAQNQFTYEWAYDVPSRFPSSAAIDMLNRAKGEIIAKVSHTRDQENEWMNGPEARKVIEIERQEKKAQEKRDAEAKIHREKMNKVYRLVHRAGVSPDEHGSWGGSGRGDRHRIEVIDYTFDPLVMRGFLAFGEGIALVADDRTRTYAKSCKWSPSTRRDMYLVGQNESGTYFAHAVPSDIDTLDAAYNWIWSGNAIESRNGDVGISIPKIIIKKSGEQKKVHIVDSHFVEGEIIQNGALYARNAVVFHEKGRQHEPVKIGNEWRKIVVARRSTKAASTKD